jgi:hypothetical protein
VLGQVQLALGHTDTALEVFAQSKELLADEPYELARTMTAWGAALCAAGDDQGIALLQESIEIYANLGAQLDRARTTTLLGSSC